MTTSMINAITSTTPLCLWGKRLGRAVEWGAVQGAGRLGCVMVEGI
jgi:hypothetical protein